MKVQIDKPRPASTGRRINNHCPYPASGDLAAGCDCEKSLMRSASLNSASEASRDLIPCGEYRVTRVSRSAPDPHMNNSANSSRSICVISPDGYTFHGLPWRTIVLAGKLLRLPVDARVFPGCSRRRFQSGVQRLLIACLDEFEHRSRQSHLLERPVLAAVPLEVSLAVTDPLPVLLAIALRNDRTLHCQKSGHLDAALRKSLDCPLDVNQKLIGHRAINDAMVE